MWGRRENPEAFASACRESSGDPGEDRSEWTFSDCNCPGQTGGQLAPGSKSEKVAFIQPGWSSICHELPPSEGGGASTTSKDTVSRSRNGTWVETKTPRPQIRQRCSAAGRPTQETGKRHLGSYLGFSTDPAMIQDPIKGGPACRGNPPVPKRGPPKSTKALENRYDSEKCWPSQSLALAAAGNARILRLLRAPKALCAPRTLDCARTWARFLQILSSFRVPWATHATLLVAKSASPDGCGSPRTGLHQAHGIF